MNGFTVINGGRGAAAALGQADSPVTENEVVTELVRRGYKATVHEPHVPPAAPTLTRSMAMNVALDEGILKMGLPRTSTHYYRCPSSAGCGITQERWGALVEWVVLVSNGYLARQYGLPGWAQGLLHQGTLHGVALSGLSGFTEWLQENTWFVQSVGDTIGNYGEYLTAKNVQDAIKANTAAVGKSFTKDDALALVTALKQGGFVAPGQTEAVAAGASAAASSPWMMPLMIGGGVLLAMLLMKK